MFGWSFPVGRGTRPATRWFAAWLTSMDTPTSSSGTSTRAPAAEPLPRAASPAQAATAAYSPLTTSTTATPTLVGSAGPGHRHQTAAGLGHHVVAGQRAVRAVGAGPAHRHPHRVGLVADPLEAQARQVPRQEVLHHHVGGLHEPAHHRGPRRGGEVEADRPAVPVHPEEVGGVVAVEGRPPGSGVVPGAGSLDLEHVGAEVGEDPAGVRPGQHPGQVEHPDAGQRAGRGRHRGPAGAGVQRSGEVDGDHGPILGSRARAGAPPGRARTGAARHRAAGAGRCS